MIDKKFRLLMLEHPQIVRNALLTDRQIDIVKSINKMFPPVYTIEIADRFDISIQNASNQLSKLTKAGYLSRKKVIAPSGGIEYEYYPVVNHLID